MITGPSKELTQEQKKAIVNEVLGLLARRTDGSVPDAIAATVNVLLNLARTFKALFPEQEDPYNQILEIWTRQRHIIDSGLSAEEQTCLEKIRAVEGLMAN